MKTHAVRKCALCILLSTCVLTGSGTGVATPAQSNSVKDIQNHDHTAPRREQASDARGNRHILESRTPLRAVTRSIVDSVPSCGSGDSMRLAILNGEREIFARDYCSAYALGGARIVTDARGKHFVLLEHGEGRGTRVTNTYLTIYEFRRILNERARILIEEPAGIGADSIYRYRVDMPRGGGIAISGIWTLNSEDLSSWEAAVAPRRYRQILEIDTSLVVRR